MGKIMENQKPKISVILPSLNVEEFISECIESVISQTLNEIEIICVDAGSTDGTMEILEKYSQRDSRIKIINSDKKSYGYQMNLGISAATGEYIGIVETDDYIDKKMYETLYDLTKNGTTDISKVSFFHVHDYDIDNIEFIPDNTKSKCPKDVFSIYDDVNILRGHPSIWAAIYKRDFLKKNNISFMEVPGGGWVDNPFLFQTFLSAKSITFRNEHCYYYREFNPKSSTNSMKDLTLPMRRMSDNLDVLDSFSCNDEDILSALYTHIFWHINETLKKDNYPNEKDLVDSYITKTVNRLEESIIINNFGLRNQRLYYQFLDNSNFESTILNTTAMVEDNLDDEKILNKKMKIIFLRYDNTKQGHKERFFNLIQNNFKELVNNEDHNEFISNLTPFNSNLFNLVLESKSFNEFDLSYDILKISEENKKLNNKNKKLIKDLKKSEDNINYIINSKSWKITKPLRKFKELLR